MPEVVSMVSLQASYEVFPFKEHIGLGKKSLNFSRKVDLFGLNRNGRAAAQRKSGFSSVSPDKLKYVINLCQQFNRFSHIRIDGKTTYRG